MCIPYRALNSLHNVIDIFNYLYLIGSGVKHISHSAINRLFPKATQLLKLCRFLISEYYEEKSFCDTTISCDTT